MRRVLLQKSFKEIIYESSQIRAFRFDILISIMNCFI